MDLSSNSSSFDHLVRSVDISVKDVLRTKSRTSIRACIIEDRPGTSTHVSDVGIKQTRVLRDNADGFTQAPLGHSADVLAATKVNREAAREERLYKSTSTSATSHTEVFITHSIKIRPLWIS